MDKLKQKFVEEASEHINDIEQSLLLLENNPEDIELIEKIFRAMHTLKGAGSMFGFEKISEFTHNLETIYDLIRNRELSLTKEIVDLTLASTDHLKLLISDKPAESEEVEEEHKLLINQINAIANFEKKDTSIAQDSEYGSPKSDEAYYTYYIYFNPNPNIFDNGTNPLYLLDELASLGSCFAIPYFTNIPQIENIEPFKCYVYWEIILATSEKTNAIDDVFIFVEDNSSLDIHRLANGNLLENKNFCKKLEKLTDREKDIGIDELKMLVKEFDKSNTSKTKKNYDGKDQVKNRDYTISSIRVASEKLDSLMNLVSELVTTQARLSLYAEDDESSELMGISENIQKLSRQLRDLAFEIVLVPIETLITRFQRLVRDLSKELDKEVIFEAQGTDTELDKTIIENLTDPLMHIIRNSIDHGIESRDERLRLGKPEKGSILLKAYHSSTNVHIEIIDDGRGIDLEKLRHTAILKGLINEDAFLSDKQLYDMVFLPGFSTAENITDISGRGVGMDVVRQKIANIRGEIELESHLNKGTKLTLKIPLTLSIIDGLLVKVGNIHYIIPLSAIYKIYAIDHLEIENKFNNLVVLDDERISYFNLRDEFNLGKTEEKTEQIIVVQYENQKIGLVVDYVVGEYQAVLKPLGKHYKNQEIISAATILGDGTIALVIDTNRAVNHFANLITYTED